MYVAVTNSVVMGTLDAFIRLVMNCVNDGAVGAVSASCEASFCTRNLTISGDTGV